MRCRAAPPVAARHRPFRSVLGLWGGRFTAWQTGAVPQDEPPICSAKGCRAHAVWVLAWNNPKLHTYDRRKGWATCDEHRDRLAQFLEFRGFLRETVPLADWTGPEDAAD